MFLTKLKIATAVLVVGAALGEATSGYTYTRYMAFLWRRLPGGKVIKNLEPKPGPKDRRVPDSANGPDAQPLERKGSRTSPRQADAPPIEQLIGQLGNERFADREAARKQLEKIGEAALGSLRQATKKNSDPEVRRRAVQLVEHIELNMRTKELAILTNLFQEGVKLEQQREYKKAADAFDRALKMGMQIYQPGAQATLGDVPFLTEVFLHSARASRELGDFVRAATSYGQAEYYASHDRDKRPQIHREWSGMVSQLLTGWSAVVRQKVVGDPILKKLADEHSLVVLHSRRYAGGGHLKSAYSFLYKTSDEETHYNDVQLQFDNGRGDKTFQLNCVNGQENRVADLEHADFRQDPDPEKVPKAGKNAWHLNECLAVEGHVYLEKVEDSHGNLFFVVFKIVAVDKESRYMAFIWRQLPGGKVVRRP